MGSGLESRIVHIVFKDSLMVFAKRRCTVGFEISSKIPRVIEIEERRWKMYVKYYGYLSLFRRVRCSMEGPWNYLS